MRRPNFAFTVRSYEHDGGFRFCFNCHIYMVDLKSVMFDDRLKKIRSQSG